MWPTRTAPSGVAALIEERGGGRAAGARPKSNPPPHARSIRAARERLLVAYQSGEPTALQRVRDFFKRPSAGTKCAARSARTPGQARGRRTVLDDTRRLRRAPARIRQLGGVRQERDWRGGRRRRPGICRSIASRDQQRTLHVRHSLEDKDWDEILAAMAEPEDHQPRRWRPADRPRARATRPAAHITQLNFGGTKRVTDDGLAHLARLPRLQELDLSDYPGGQITDRGLDVLRHLPELRRFQMCWQSAITDAGVANLRFCEKLESVDLLGTHTGDGAIAALAGKGALHRLKTGRRVTDAALPLLHQLPIFKTWHGGTVKYSLMSADAEPNHLLLDGPFTERWPRERWRASTGSSGSPSSGTSRR